MTIFIGADHRGFNLREYLKKKLVNDGYDVVDMGNTTADPSDDYPDFAKAVAQKVSEHPDQDRGIVICGSGAGVEIVANKFKGIRATLSLSVSHISTVRHDDNVNVLALAADFVDEPTAATIVDKFLNVPFATEEQYSRRLKKIADLEK